VSPPVVIDLMDEDSLLVAREAASLQQESMDFA